MASIIKAAGAKRLEDGMPFNFEDMSVSAQQYLDQVRVRAGALVVRAEQDAAAVRKRAEEAGRQAALEAADRSLDEKIGRQMVTLMPALQQAVEGMQRARQAWLAHSEQTVVRLATAIAGRVVRRELEKQPEITLTLVKEALELAAGSTDIRLRLHPDDHAALAGQVGQLVAELSRLGAAEVLADPSITRGGCRVETRYGVIDQQLEAQLARIEEELA